MHSYPKLLIVNFNKADRTIIKKSLADANLTHTSQPAADELDAHEFLQKKTFSCILLNENGSAQKALDFILQLRTERNNIPVLLIADAEHNFNSDTTKLLAPVQVMVKQKLKDSELRNAIQQLIASHQTENFTTKDNAKISEHRYKVLFENAHGFICTHSMTGEILSINRAAAKILGYKVSELLGHNLREFLIEDKQNIFDDYLHELKTHHKATGIMQFMSKDSEKRYLVYRNVVHFEPATKPYVIASSQDITDIFLIEKQLESANRISELNINRLHKTLLELDKAKKIAEESVRIKQEFLANMSHEIRTPMNAIIGFASLLEKSLLNNEQTDYLSAIKISGENLLVIINDILDFSKIDAGMMSIEKTQFDIDVHISKIINQFEPKIREKNLLLKHNFNFKRNLNVIGDPVRLLQVLSNLISNAIKFTEKGGITVSVNVKNETAERIWIELIVSDTGIGIPADKVETVFESFTQASPETTRKYGGTGLGLAIVKKLLELQNGFIALKSHMNVGTTFTFTIPYEKVEYGNNETQHPLEIKSEVENFFGLKVLLVEDNLLNQKLVTKLLEDLNCRVDIANNGLEAIEKVKTHHYEIIIMDIQMPEMDGLQATRIMRNQLGIITPIIALTAHTFKEEEDKCIEAGMNDFLSKPFTRGDLFRIIRANIDSKLAPNANSTKLTDLTFLNELADGNKEFIKKMLEIYVKQTPENIGSLETFAADNNYDGISSVAHKMRSSVPYVGLGEVEKLLEKLEFEAKQRINVNNYAHLVSEIKRMCEISITEVNEHLKGFAEA